MRYMDEMRGSVGESCLVIDVLDDKLLRPATVLSLSEADGTVLVRFTDNDTCRVVSYKLVQLEGEAA